MEPEQRESLDPDQAEEKPFDRGLSDNEEYELAHAHERINDARAINRGRY
jgi:hypothetical protein